MTETTSEYAVHWVPTCDRTLSALGLDWLGWCPEHGMGVKPGAMPAGEDDQMGVVSETGRWGLTAHLGGPVVVRPEERYCVEAAIERAVERQAPVELQGLVLGVVDERLALVPTKPEPALRALRAAVEGACRANGLARGRDRDRQLWAVPPRGRATAGVGEEAMEMPIVKAEEFHLALTDPLPAGVRANVALALRERLAPLAEQTFRIGDVAMLSPPERGARARVQRRFELGAASEPSALGDEDDPRLPCFGPILLVPPPSDPQPTVSDDWHRAPPAPPLPRQTTRSWEASAWPGAFI